MSTDTNPIKAQSPVVQLLRNQTERLVIRLPIVVTFAFPVIRPLSTGRWEELEAIFVRFLIS